MSEEGLDLLAEEQAGGAALCSRGLSACVRTVIHKLVCIRNGCANVCGLCE